jgi:hypothetical protein
MKRVLKGVLQVLLGLAFLGLHVYGMIWANTPPPDSDIERLLGGRWPEEYWEWDGKDWQGGQATTTYVVMAMARPGTTATGR